MSVIVCSSCDLAHRAGMGPAAERTRCARCRAPLQRPENGSIDTAIALAVTALVLFLLSNAYPLVAILYNGTTRAATLVDAVLAFYHQGHLFLAALVFITTVVGPFLQIACLLYLLIPLRRNHQAPGQDTIFRLLSQVRPWTFIEVFMLGALVALVRVAAYARVIPGVALWSCGLLMLTLAALTSRTSAAQFWSWVEGSRA
ncbi:MAG TPA: paraquat-inducible protein A [Steroidobacteraceae bacterium]